MANKSNRIIIRLNDIDLAIIKKKAELLQMSVSEYLRTAGTQRKVDGFNKSIVCAQEDVQIDGQMSIQDFQKKEEPEAKPKPKKKQTKTAKKEVKKV